MIAKECLESLARKTALLVPTYNGGVLWQRALAAVSDQTLQPHLKLIIDSSSTDDSVLMAEAAGFNAIVIPQHEYRHGGTRQRMVDHAAMAGCEYLVLLTQDAVLADRKSLETIVRKIASDARLGAVCGRQLPHKNATPIAKFARIYNYPEVPRLCSIKDIPEHGIKAAFLSNSYAVYRRQALAAVGGFKSDVLFGEDMVAAAMMLEAGWLIAYDPNSCVYHSHNMSFKDEYVRSRNIGSFHKKEKWLLERFGAPTTEGMRFVINEIKFLARNAPLYIVEALARTLVKYVGYNYGRM